MNIHNDLLLLAHYDIEFREESDRYNKAKDDREKHLQSFVKYFPHTIGTMFQESDNSFLKIITKIRHCYWDNMVKEIGFCIEYRKYEYNKFSDNVHAMTATLSECNLFSTLTSNK